jgi:hypothetical protein
VVHHLEAALTEAMHSCRSAHGVRALRRALLDALRKLDEQGETE